MAQAGPAAGAAPVGRVLLLGNSRWHWAEPDGAGSLRCWHLPPGTAIGAPGELVGWAAVGAVPAAAGLPTERRIGLEQVPLAAAPPWLGIDRALAGWWAWQQQPEGDRGGVLVADAGTALSLSRVDGAGAFAGGRLLAGVGLQLRSLAAGTYLLPELALGGALALPPDPWPRETAAAMARGCLEAAAAAIAAAWRDVALTNGPGDPASGPSAGLPAGPAVAPWSLWLTGGDAGALLPLLQRQGLPVRWAPELCLEALAALTGLAGTALDVG